MIKHIFFNKCNTMIENSDINTGFNPVAELNVGDNVSRILINFDLTDIKNLILEDEARVEELQHKIHMTNCGMINHPLFDNEMNVGYLVDKKRASSFNIIAFKIPFSWDEGKGYDFNGDLTEEKYSIISKDGSNWFQRKNNSNWSENGVYSNITLKTEYEKFNNNQESIIIAEQHFDYGTENLEIDITNYINDILSNNKEFHGIGLAFNPQYELDVEENRYVSFFTNHTNTFFHPYLETKCNKVVLDNRANFHSGIKNRLYFFVSDDGEYVNLDRIPKCTIEGIDYNVKQGGKGTYYIEVFFRNSDYEAYTILSDVWSDLVLDGETIDDVEMEFVVLPFEEKLTIGKHKNNEYDFSPQLYGINDSEKIKIGDIREVMVDFIEDYSYGKKIIPPMAEYRVYVKEHNREIEIFPYQTIERRFDEHSFIIDSNDLIPNHYHIDIRIKQGKNVKHFENVLDFLIVNDITEYGK